MRLKKATGTNTIAERNQRETAEPEPVGSVPLVRHHLPRCTSASRSIPIGTCHPAGSALRAAPLDECADSSQRRNKLSMLPSRQDKKSGIEMFGTVFMSPVKIAMCVLAGVGSFAIVVALLLPTLVYDALAVTPLDIAATTVATTADGADGAGGEVLDSRTITGPGPLSIATDVPLVFQRYITVEDPSDADRVTFQAGATVRRADRDGEASLLTASVDRVTSDRRTGLPVEPAGSLQTTVDLPASPLPRTGLQHRFPFDTQPTTYAVYDATAWTSFDANFIEEITMDGLPVFHFRSIVTEADLSTTTQSPINSVTLPASKWGVGDGDEPITMKQWYSNVRDIYVEPTSGSLVWGKETPHQYFARDPKVPEVTIFKASLALDETGRLEQVASARDAANKLAWLTSRGPILGYAVGGVCFVGAIAAGVIGSRRPRSPEPTRQHADDAERASV